MNQSQTRRARAKPAPYPLATPPRYTCPQTTALDKFLAKTDDSIAYIIVIISYYYSVQRLS
ncbi:hypothetical protein FOT81_02225 [Raoultella planticola]|nr:hypothetical protein [Raoultella planticola]MBZ7830843.1 hypothetical protein [Raoultella planticola]